MVAAGFGPRADAARASELLNLIGGADDGPPLRSTRRAGAGRGAEDEVRGQAKLSTPVSRLVVRDTAATSRRCVPRRPTCGRPGSSTSSSARSPTIVRRRGDPRRIRPDRGGSSRFMSGRCCAGAVDYEGLVRRALDEDVGTGDVTTRGYGRAGRRGPRRSSSRSPARHCRPRRRVRGVQGRQPRAAARDSAAGPRRRARRARAPVIADRRWTCRARC